MEDDLEQAVPLGVCPPGALLVLRRALDVLARVNKAESAAARSRCARSSRGTSGCEGNRALAQDRASQKMNALCVRRAVKVSSAASFGKWGNRKGLGWVGAFRGEGSFQHEGSAVALLCAASSLPQSKRNCQELLQSY